MIVQQPTEPWHVGAMVPRMPGDMLDDSHVLGKTPGEVMQSCVDLSVHMRTAMLDDTPVALWGLHPSALDETRAMLWMLGTVDAKQHPRHIIKMSKAYVSEIQGHYRLLDALIDERHADSIRWVRHLGFTPTGHSVTVQGITFVGFERVSRHGH